MLVPNKFKRKVPPFFLVEEGRLNLSITPGRLVLLALLWAPVIPDPEDLPWLPTFIHVHASVAKLFRSLPESMSLSGCFTGLGVACNSFTRIVMC